MKTKEMTDISSTLLKGRITELKCELWLLEQGYVVSIPDVPYQYDFLVDIGNKILKIQVKTCRLNNDETGISFNLCSVTHNQQGYTKRTYNENVIDYFMTEYQNNFYLVPFKECGTKEKKLRLVPPKNGQIKGISFAKDYLASKILEKEEVIK